MKGKLSLPVESNSKLAPKHKVHGTPIGDFLPEDVARDLNYYPSKKKAGS